MILMYRIMKEDLNIKRELLFPEVRQSYTRGHHGHLKVQLGKPVQLLMCDRRASSLLQSTSNSSLE